MAIFSPFKPRPLSVDRAITGQRHSDHATREDVLHIQVVPRLGFGAIYQDPDTGARVYNDAFRGVTVAQLPR